MRSELKIPLQLAGVRVQGQYASRIEVIAGTGIPHEIRRRVARGPIERVELRIISAGHPGCATAMQIGIPGPTRGTKFAGAGNGPETPLGFSGGGIIRSYKATD